MQLFENIIPYLTTKVKRFYGVAMKEFCRYAVWDNKTGVMLVCGEKYKVKQNLDYLESFRCFRAGFRKIQAFVRKTVIKGREVDIVYWFNTPRRNPSRAVMPAGLVLGLQ